MSGTGNGAKSQYDLHFFSSSGVIPKTVMDSMEFLMHFHFPKHVCSKKGHRKRHSFKGKKRKRNGKRKNKIKMELCPPPVCFFIFPEYTVIRSVKMAPWTEGRSKVTPAVSEQSPESRHQAGHRQILRRSLGLETFPNVQLFRTCVPCAGEEKQIRVIISRIL